MRAIVVAILSAILCNGPLEAQTSNQTSLAEQSAVQQTLIELYRAVSTRDVARYRALCTADYLLIERDELMTIDRDIASFVSRTATQRKRTDRLDFRSTRVVGDTAFVVYLLTSDFESDGKVEQRTWSESAMLVRSAGGWKVSLLHSAPLGVVGRDAPPAWAVSLPVQPGDSLKNVVDDGRDKQVVTFFQLADMREIDGTVFISGSGYVEIKGGGSYFSGMNRAQDPFLELTITAPDAPVFQQCRGLLDKQNLVSNAIAIGGEGYFMSMPGARERGLGIIRLDTITRCGLVPRR